MLSSALTYFIDFFPICLSFPIVPDNMVEILTQYVNYAVLSNKTGEIHGQIYLGMSRDLR
jgi:hypothetical protein